MKGGEIGVLTKRGGPCRTLKTPARLREQLDDFGVTLVVSVGRHQAFEFFKPVESDVSGLALLPDLVPSSSWLTAPN